MYIFIHKITGHKYVGSSNLLRRRLETYFKFTFSDNSTVTGKFLPILKEEGLKALIATMPKY